MDYPHSHNNQILYGISKNTCTELCVEVVNHSRDASKSTSRKPITDAAAFKSTVSDGACWHGYYLVGTRARFLREQA